VLRNQSEQVSSPEEAFVKMSERLESEQKRYWNLYQINNKDLTQFNLVINTKENNLEEVVSIILTEYQKWLNN